MASLARLCLAASTLVFVTAVKPADMSYYFTLRDSFNFDVREAFGLIVDCDTDHCKMSGNGTAAAHGNVSGWEGCTSSIVLEDGVSHSEKKGMALDDTTFQKCADKIPNNWPHTSEPIRAIRMFKLWNSDWGEGRLEAWDQIHAFLERNNATVLLGTQVSCNKSVDEQDWSFAKAFMKQVGRQRINGLAIGNEMELYSQKAEVTVECANEMWHSSESYPKGYFYHAFEQRVKELDVIEGFHDVVLTSVWGGHGVSSNPLRSPFRDDSDCSNAGTGEVSCCMVNTFMTNVLKAWGTRVAFSINIYPYFSGGASLDSDGGCASTLNKGLDLHGGEVGMYLFRTRLAMARMGYGDSLLWMGETGWSSPMSDTLSNEDMRKCEAWSSEETLLTFYRHFTAWDTSVGDFVNWRLVIILSIVAVAVLVPAVVVLCCLVLRKRRQRSAQDPLLQRSATTESEMVQ